VAFTGEFRHTIDAKGRVIVPSRMRDELAGDQVVLTRWLEECIAIWSPEGWARIEERLEALGEASVAARKLRRAVMASAHPDAVDKQGRITVPQHLRELAGIERDCVVVGAGNRGEIWSPQRWQQQQADVAEEGRLEELVSDLNF
jgi:MraZ protein